VTLFLSACTDAGHDAPTFIDGVAMSATSAVVVVGEGCNVPPPNVPLLSLRGNRSDPWFFWHLASLARTLPAVSNKQVMAAAATAAGQGAHSEYCLLDDYLFRFDRGAFWMARHGLHVFWGKAAFGEDLSQPAGPAWWIRVKYAWLATTRQLCTLVELACVFVNVTM
jgi:hypothetical protein